MNKGEIKEYKIVVGIDNPPIDDINDDFEITLPISDDEVEAIINADLKLYWEKNAVDTWEYIECFAPEAYKKGKALAEAYCVPKWGDKMKVENGAYYEFFLPDEINDKIINDPRWVYENNIRAEKREASRLQFHEDHKIFHQNNDNGRFKNKLIGDPLWNNSVFAGSWSEGLHDYAGEYGFHTIILNGIEFSYERIFRRDFVEFCVVLRSPIDDYLEGFFSHYNGIYKMDDFDMKPNYSPPAMIAKSKGDLCDIEFFMSFLEYIISQ